MNPKINPWETPEGKKVWKTKSEYFVWIRGQIRKIWADYPLRKVWKNSMLRPLTADEKLSKKFHFATKKVGQCVFCEQWFAGSKLECDHIEASEGCNDFDNLQSFLLHCGADNASNFQLVCKDCHKIKSHSERKGISFEDARLDKEAIAFFKENPIDQAKQILLKFGASEDELSNDKKRRACFIRLKKNNKF